MRTTVRVLHSFRTPRATTNPYIVMLRQGLRAQDEIISIDFDWRTALTGQWDVFHLHWPEVLIGGKTWAARLLRQSLFLVLLLRARIQRRAVVRTQHNVDLPAGLSRRETALLRLVDRWTTLRIVLNRHTPTPPGTASVLIPHGHYHEWFADYPREESVTGRISFVGQVRRYKGIDTLLRAFAETSSDVTLRVAGQPTSDAIRSELAEAAAGEPRISVRLEFLDEPSFVEEVTSAELVVLPYPKMHNSGATIAALSLARPVLIPDNPINRDLSAEIGPGWVNLFSGSLDGADLQNALVAARAAQRPALPDLAERHWDRTGAAHLAAYRAALARVQRPRGRGRPYSSTT